jgi:hypothetical protein
VVVAEKLICVLGTGVWKVAMPVGTAVFGFQFVGVLKSLLTFPTQVAF